MMRGGHVDICVRGAIPLAALMARNPNVGWQAVTDVIFSCAN